MFFVITIIIIIIIIYVIGLILEGLGILLFGGYYAGKAIKDSYQETKFQNIMSIDKVDDEFVKYNDLFSVQRTLIKNFESTDEIFEVDNIKFKFKKIIIKKIKFLSNTIIDEFNSKDNLHLKLNDIYSIVVFRIEIQNNSQNHVYIELNKALCLAEQEQSSLIKSFDNFSENDNNFMVGVKKEIIYDFLLLNTNAENIKNLLFYLKINNKNEINKKFDLN